ncbi:unnamed protein product [Paramecium sonneborni]|uniref:Uncharacterized protein n=1 Tax=Paramecium sonneborni TaxID=65129 RepID=A0A8S1RUP8_9CILI|nr:unnamed protein product [Paramecium sonneborni]
MKIQINAQIVHISVIYVKFYLSVIIRIEQIVSTCKCPTGTYYQDALKKCSYCHYTSCFNFRNTIVGYLTCHSTLYKILKGLKCECKTGYYDFLNICQDCPTTVDISFNQCYKYFNNNQIWHNIAWDICDFEFQLIAGVCQPICGDLEKKGHE